MQAHLRRPGRAIEHKRRLARRQALPSGQEQDLAVGVRELRQGLKDRRVLVCLRLRGPLQGKTFAERCSAPGGPTLVGELTPRDPEKPRPRVLRQLFEATPGNEECLRNYVLGLGSGRSPQRVGKDRPVMGVEEPLEAFPSLLMLEARRRCRDLAVHPCGHTT